MIFRTYSFNNFFSVLFNNILSLFLFTFLNFVLIKLLLPIGFLNPLLNNILIGRFSYQIQPSVENYQIPNKYTNDSITNCLGYCDVFQCLVIIKFVSHYIKGYTA